MDWLLKFVFQRRIAGSLLLSLAGAIGIPLAETDAARFTAAIAAFLPVGAYAWSYFHRLDREWYRRLIGGSVAITYAVLGALDLGMTDKERAEFSETFGGLLQAIFGITSGASTASVSLYGVGGALGVLSFFTPNPVQPTRLASPNP